MLCYVMLLCYRPYVIPSPIFVGGEGREWTNLNKIVGMSRGHRLLGGQMIFTYPTESAYSGENSLVSILVLQGDFIVKVVDNIFISTIGVFDWITYIIWL